MADDRDSAGERLNLFRPDPMRRFGTSDVTCTACGRIISGRFAYPMPREEPLYIVRCAAYRRDMSFLGIERPKTVAEKLSKDAPFFQKPNWPRRPR